MSFVESGQKIFRYDRNDGGAAGGGSKVVPDKVDIANAATEAERFELSLQMLRGKLVHKGPDIFHWRSHAAARDAEKSGRWDLGKD